MARKIKRIAKNSTLMDIEIIYNNDKIKFNLAEELSISESRINLEITDQPTHQGFLNVLVAKLKGILEDAIRKEEKKKAQVFLSWKEERDSNTGRPYSNDIAEAHTLSDSDYQIVLKRRIKAEEDYLTIKACVDAFNQRSSLIQTIAANKRKEIN